MKRKFSKTRIGPKRASQLLACNNYPGQRPLDAKNVKSLLRKMEDGRFHVGSIAVIHVNGDTLLMDGQHQLTASSQSGITFDAVFQEYWAEDGDTRQDIAEVFAQYNNDKSRTKSNVAWIYACQLGWTDWSQRCVSCCNTALGFLEGPNGEFSANSGFALGKDENAQLLCVNQKECQFIHRVIWQDGRDFLYRAAVVAAAMVTFRKSKQDAERFWSEIRDGVNLKRGCPQLKLRDYLIGIRIRSNTMEKSVTHETVYRKCIYAWNAFRSGSTTSLRCPMNSPQPKPK